MISAGIKDLRNQLSRYLTYVKGGEDVAIIERGKVIARIVQERSQKTSLRQALLPFRKTG